MEDRRRDPRFPTDQAAELVLLAEADRRVAARVLDVSGRGARVRSEAKLEAGAAVRIDLNNTMLLGEVTYCMEAAGEFLIGVQIEQMLSNVSDVTRLMGNLIGHEIFSRIPK